MSIDNNNETELVLNEVAAEEAKPDAWYSPPTTIINCSLQVKLDPENIAVYVCKGSKQCFSFTALKCCGKGDITITAQDFSKWDKWHYGVLEIDKFGKFELNNGGICFTPNDKLGEGNNPTKFVTLNFKASQCNATNVIFSVTFVYDPCKCCCGCRS